MSKEMIPVRKSKQKLIWETKRCQKKEKKDAIAECVRRGRPSTGCRAD